MNPALIEIGLAIFGLGSLLWWAFVLARRAVKKAARRWLWPRLSARHERLCRERNLLWKGRIIRHATTGRVGLCLKVCVRAGWRGLLWPRWIADIVLDVRLAVAMAQPPRPGYCVQIAYYGYHDGVLEAMRLDELTLAPSGEAEIFRRQMEESAQ
jgi:hypothetical protein